MTMISPLILHQPEKAPIEVKGSRNGPSPAEGGAIVWRVTAYGIAGLLGASLFVSSLIILHLARTDIDWTKHYVSDFANGRLGWIFVFGILVHGLGNFAIDLGLRESLNPGPLRAWAVLLFGLSAAGIVIAALFPTDPLGAARTPVGRVHWVAATVSFPLELVALFLFSTAFARNPLWRGRRRISFALATVAAIVLAGLFLAVLLNRMPGLAERLALASFLAWEFWAALQLARPFGSLASRKGRPA
jgi:hypothetical membrane protein